MPTEFVLPNVTDRDLRGAEELRKKHPGWSWLEKLTDGGVSAVRGGKPIVIRRKTRYLNDGLGLLLCVSPSPTDPEGARRSWVFRWSGEKVKSKNGKVHRKHWKVGLGSLLTTDLQWARTRAAEMRRLVQEGKNPLLVKRGRAAQEKVAELQLKTLRAAVDAYVLRHSAAWKPKYVADFRNLFRHLDPILDLPVQSLTPNIIVQELAPLWDTHPDSGRRLRANLEQVINLAMSNGWREHGQNPAAWTLVKYHFQPRHKLQPVKHHAALDYRSIASFVAKVRATEGVTARAIELIVLTAVRASEVILAAGEEFDLESEKPTWRIPWERTKTGKRTQEPHIVPLSPQAVACLRRVKMNPGELMFPIHNRAAYRLARDIAEQAITVHGFRSSFSTWAAEQTDYRYEIKEAALDHQVGDDVRRRYERTSWLDQRRALLRDWADWCDGKISEPADNVVPLRAYGE